jgi:hypothetical protein
VKISVSGLMATCFQPKENLLVTNMGFEEGEHYWEFITPINCNGMQLGVVESGYDLEDLTLVKDVTKMVTQSFRTTTPRVIGILINFNKLTLNYWLNDNL